MAGSLSRFLPGGSRPVSARAAATGLGAHSQHIVQAHGGEAWVTSEFRQRRLLPFSPSPTGRAGRRVITLWIIPTAVARRLFRPPRQELVSAGGFVIHNPTAASRATMTDRQTTRSMDSCHALPPGINIT